MANKKKRDKPAKTIDLSRALKWLPLLYKLYELAEDWLSQF